MHQYTWHQKHRFSKKKSIAYRFPLHHMPWESKGTPPMLPPQEKYKWPYKGIINHHCSFLGSHYIICFHRIVLDPKIRRPRGDVEQWGGWLLDAWKNWRWLKRPNVLCMLLPGAPMTSIFEGQPSKPKAFSNQKGHLGSRYVMDTISHLSLNPIMVVQCFAGVELLSITFSFL